MTRRTLVAATVAALTSLSIPAAAQQVYVQPAAGGIQVDSHPVRLSFEGHAEGVLQLHRAVASAWAVGPGGAAYGRQYEPICAAPCSATVPSGTYELAISRDGGGEVPVPGVLRLDRDSTLEGIYEDRSGLRAAGWITMIGGLAVGLGVGTAGLVMALDNTSYSGAGANAEMETAGWIMAGVGLGVALVAEVVGLLLAMHPDRAEIRVR